MNKQRRKEINTIIKKLYALKSSITTGNKDIDITNILNDISDNVSFILSDEEYYMDNMPENLQNGCRYEQAEEACDNLENAMDCLRDISHKGDKEALLSNVDDAIDYLSEAAM